MSAPFLIGKNVQAHNTIAGTIAAWQVHSPFNTLFEHFHHIHVKHSCQPGRRDSCLRDRCKQAKHTLTIGIYTRTQHMYVYVLLAYPRGIHVVVILILDVLLVDLISTDSSCPYYERTM